MSAVILGLGLVGFLGYMALHDGAASSHAAQGEMTDRFGRSPDDQHFGHDHP